MDVQQLTYMLLPNFSFQPDAAKLGTLLPLSDETKLPDPTLPLTDDNTRISIEKKLVKSEAEEPQDKPWKYVGKTTRGTSGGFSVDIPFISAISVGFDAKHEKCEDIDIECQKVETCWFIPSKQHIAKALQDAYVQEYATQHWRPTVFMVTGIKVATDVKIISGRNVSRDLSGSLGVDLTGVGKRTSKTVSTCWLYDHTYCMRCSC